MKAKGFSLLELMVVTMILAIFLTLVIPAAVTMVQSIKIANASNTLHRSLKYARSEAIMRSKSIRICASGDGVLCSKDKNWANGWLIYLDQSNKLVRTPDDPVLRFNPPLDGLDIKYNLRGHTVKFNSDGRLTRNGSFYICDRTGKVGPNRLVMIHSGRVRQTRVGAKCS